MKPSNMHINENTARFQSKKNANKSESNNFESDSNKTLEKFESDQIPSVMNIIHFITKINHESKQRGLIIVI